MRTSATTISGIDCLQVLGDDPSVGVVFLHGYGANMQDLFPLWEYWHLDKFNWYFPNGVLDLNMGYYSGRAWFSIDMARLEKALQEGKHRDMASHEPPEFQSTLGKLESLISELAKKHETLVVGGFSQGAMCAFHLAMNDRLKIDGLVLLSGNLVADAKVPKKARPIPFYQSHGTRDPILHIDGARAMEDKLRALNFQGKLHSFNGGHEIPSGVIAEVKSFLNQFSQQK